MKPSKAHLLFEQSGTFKKAFAKYDIPAEDYDILNEFGETDHIIDLFAEIRGGIRGEPSIFDNISKTDIIIAFFPCVRFEDQITILMRCEAPQQQKWTWQKKLEYAMKLNNELNEMYILVSMLAHIAFSRGLQLIIENPCGGSHYLTRYWPIKPGVIDRDRTLRGDYYTKPTQYWFIGRDPHHNFEWEIQEERKIYKVSSSELAKDLSIGIKTSKSMISPEYAERFIREFIL